MFTLYLVLLSIGIAVSACFWALYGVVYLILKAISKIIYG